MDSILTLLASAEARALGKGALFYGITLFGAIAMHVFQQARGFKGAIGFLREFLPGRSRVFYVRADFIVVVIAGSIIASIVYAPTAYAQALAAGFGWTGAMKSLIASPANEPE